MSVLRSLDSSCGLAVSDTCLRPFAVEHMKIAYILRIIWRATHTWPVARDQPVGDPCNTLSHDFVFKLCESCDSLPHPHNPCMGFKALGCVKNV